MKISLRLKRLRSTSGAFSEFQNPSLRAYLLSLRLCVKLQFTSILSLERIEGSRKGAKGNA
ncbi:MAG: hypothetical protein AUG51_15715 [Acidobacteria bacterium 13_1_20CM_3_53_8]|nr:MAG: hypothetical protein AUG51_15715 [Acidobacteria bacterium 13_1_20CM_3_53_8]